MSAPVNPFKKALTEGKTLFGCWLGLANTFSAEMMGQAGFDWLVVDGEHAPNDLRSILAQLQVLAGTDSHAVVRVPVGETWMIKQTLDAGAQTILVPMVESVEQARQLVRAVTFPPNGDRGVGFALTRAAQFNLTQDYGTTADEQICLLVQIENRKGMAALDDILAIDGIDGVFIGPADLAADLGHMGNSLHPDVQSVIMDALTRIAASGKAAGILAVNDDMVRNAISAGASFVAVGADILLLGQAARDLASKWRNTTK
ncbi:2-keto-3-deoxy-L-rhamnonate aldolase [Sulfitobacter sp. SK012]|uniref:HpcH/HpaI aldolase family protein n=1 Tax=Sulfitobacter sp. SK012 TaxID=1389005 RepID=UPI000E09FF6A|nr:HpcH/HpaI aldolase/citrate lyase family protein [Sulfitobacter sp. SK012]AXI44873.1 2-keto-3-deoxy-L-rhamnonate aldolase [Sulfitobacter sp. SK012]